MRSLLNQMQPMCPLKVAVLSSYLDIVQLSSPLVDKVPSDFTTSQAAAVFEAIRTCWSQDVCIPEIGHRFWRLTLQVCPSLT